MLEIVLGCGQVCIAETLEGSTASPWEETIYPKKSKSVFAEPQIHTFSMSRIDDLDAGPQERLASVEDDHRWSC